MRMGTAKKRPIEVKFVIAEKREVIKTLEGDMVAEPGDYIVTGVKGERYPVKPDIFPETFEEINEPARKLAAELKKVRKKLQMFMKAEKHNVVMVLGPGLEEPEHLISRERNIRIEKVLQRGDKIVILRGQQ